MLDHPFVVRAEATVLLNSALKKNIIAAVELQPFDGASAATNELPQRSVSGTPTFTSRMFEVADELIDSVQNVLGGLAAPRTIIFVDRLAKNARTVLGNLTADQLPSSTHAAFLPWQEITERAEQ